MPAAAVVALPQRTQHIRNRAQCRPVELQIANMRSAGHPSRKDNPLYTGSFHRPHEFCKLYDRDFLMLILVKYRIGFPRSGTRKGLCPAAARASATLIGSKPLPAITATRPALSARRAVCSSIFVAVMPGSAVHRIERRCAVGALGIDIDEIDHVNDSRRIRYRNQNVFARSRIGFERSNSIRTA